MPPGSIFEGRSVRKGRASPCRHRAGEQRRPQYFDGPGLTPTPRHNFLPLPMLSSKREGIRLITAIHIPWGVERLDHGVLICPWYAHLSPVRRSSQRNKCKGRCREEDTLRRDFVVEDPRFFTFMPSIPIIIFPSERQKSGDTSISASGSTCGAATKHGPTRRRWRLGRARAPWRWQTSFFTARATGLRLFVHK